MLILCGALALGVGLVLHAHDADAVDFVVGAPETYYEKKLGGASVSAFTNAAPELPTRLYVDPDDTIDVRLQASPQSEGTLWKLSVTGCTRQHERISAVYQIVLALPLPAVHGTDAFRPRAGPIHAETPGGRPFFYGGEPLVYRRNPTLERMWLPLLVGSDEGKLPDLSGSGYAWTFWDTVVAHDPDHGPVVEGSLHFVYRTDSDVQAPDPGDSRFSVFLITWIPLLDASIPPSAVRSSFSF